VNGKHQRRLNSERQPENFRRGQVDSGEQVAKSRGATEDSLAMLRRNDRMEIARNPETRRRQMRRGTR
jgi:hypothetical protein